MTLVLALAASAALPAAAGAATGKTSVYHLLKASGSQRVTFSADPNTCLRFITCGNSGTVTYKFGGAPSGRLVLEQDGRGHITGAAAFKSRGTTVSDVTTGAVCSDTVRHRREEFSMQSRSRLGKLIFRLHGGETDYLATDCAGPTEAQLKHDRGLPTGMFKRKDFDAQRTTFRLRGSSSFREKGYRGTTNWKLSYKVRRG